MRQKHRFVVRPLFLQVRDELASRIAAGTWKAGALLPNEVQLAEDFGVSQGTVRKALDLLESERIVSRRQGRGTIVVDHDTEEMGIRFSSIFNSNGERISGQIVTCRAELGLSTDAEREALGMQAVETVIRAARTRAYQGRPFLHEVVALAGRLFPGLDPDSLKDTRLSTIAQRHGVQLRQAKESVRPVMCPDEHLDKLALTSPVPVLLLTRTTFALDGTAVEFRSAWCHLGDQHYMSITS